MKYLSHLYQLLNKHKLALILAVLIAIGLIAIGVKEDSFSKTITYLTIMGICFLLSEFIYFSGNPVFSNWKIKRPKRELTFTLFVVLVASALMTYWFTIVDQANAGQTIRIVMMVMRILFVFPVILLVYYLAIEKYNPRAIGIWGLKYWFVSLPLIVVIGGITYLIFPEGMLQNTSIQAFIVFGFLTAAIPEEVARTLFQSRLGHFINNKALAWFIVSLIWALQHIPIFASNSGGNYYEAMIGALGILPIGLLWGYLNERYRSIIPSVLMHGTNLWGLHNIF